eukprot:TRINITY_DN2035_c0_g2_i1.p1 TRINITY_DN2035_c0_g2~~TRINITY_DN2035_c0_g2_i1.p1  ORF type:complete len:171 (+),score=39.87 TRINITY_DN2035_c0_g2_i1:276-788(+)
MARVRFISPEAQLQEEQGVQVSNVGAWAIIKSVSEKPSDLESNESIGVFITDGLDRIFELEEAVVQLREENVQMREEMARLNHRIIEESSIRETNDSIILKMTGQVENLKEAISELRRCQICFDGVREYVLVPCYHLACCQNCANQSLQTSQRCPFCRIPCTEIRRVISV